MKVIVVGSSIAGSAMALALSKSCEVSVYEGKGRNEIHEKTCGNICTYSIEKHLMDLGIDESASFILSRYNKINVFSRNNQASFPTQEYEISRKELLSKIIKGAERNGAKFNFGFEFLGFQKKNGRYDLIFKRKGKKFSDSADVIIGADGAMSRIAKSVGKENRKFFLFLQAKVRRSQIGKADMIPDKNSYNLFVGKKAGYYSYIFPSNDGKEFKIGLGGDFESEVSERFRLFLKQLGVRNAKVRGALIPKPNFVKGKGKVHLIGDASCNVKYSGGGIVPILEQALALRDKILENKSGRMRKVRRKAIINRRLTKFIEKMDDEDFDEVLETLKDDKFKRVFEGRDDVGIGDILRMMHPRTLLMASRIMLR